MTTIQNAPIVVEKRTGDSRFYIYIVYIISTETDNETTVTTFTTIFLIEFIEIGIRHTHKRLKRLREGII